jgi:hypothetical protein
MVTCSVVVLTVKALSPSALLTRVATTWIHTGRNRAATAPQGQGVLRLRLRRLHLLATPQVMMPFRSAPKRTSTSNRRSSGRVKRPCRIGGGLIFTDNFEDGRRRSRAAAAGEEAGGAGEEAGGASTNKSSFTFCYVIDISGSTPLTPLSVMMLIVIVPVAWAHM